MGAKYSDTKGGHHRLFIILCKITKNLLWAVYLSCCKILINHLDFKCINKTRNKLALLFVCVWLLLQFYNSWLNHFNRFKPNNVMNRTEKLCWKSRTTNNSRKYVVLLDLHYIEMLTVLKTAYELQYASLHYRSVERSL